LRELDRPGLAESTTAPTDQSDASPVEAGQGLRGV